MNNFAQFLADSKKALTYLNDDVNTVKFNATEKFNDIYIKAIQTIQEKYSLPSLHIWETGYCQGDATDEEIFETICKINLEQGNDYLSCDADLFNFLDDELVEEMQENVDNLIHDFDTFVKNELGVTITLNRSDVRQLLVDEMKIAHDFSWTGWRIPIYLDGADDIEAGDAIECNLSSGGWLSNNSWQPNAIEVYKIESWSLDYDIADDMDENEEIIYSIDEMLDYCEWEEKIEYRIHEYFNNKFESEYEVKVEWI